MGKQLASLTQCCEGRSIGMQELLEDKGGDDGKNDTIKLLEKLQHLLTNESAKNTAQIVQMVQESNKVQNQVVSELQSGFTQMTNSMTAGLTQLARPPELPRKAPRKDDDIEMTPSESQTLNAISRVSHPYSRSGAGQYGPIKGPSEMDPISSVWNDRFWNRQES